MEVRDDTGPKVVDVSAECSRSRFCISAKTLEMGIKRGDRPPNRLEGILNGEHASIPTLIVLGDRTEDITLVLQACSNARQQ